MNLFKKCYENSRMITHEINSDKTLSSFNLEKKRLKYILKDVNDVFSCYVANTNMMKYKHMINFNNIFDPGKIGKCWYQRKVIVQSCNIGSCTSPSFIISIAELEDDDLYKFTIIEHESDDHESNNNQHLSMK